MSTNNGGFGKSYASMYTGSMFGAGAATFAVMGYVIANQVPGGDDKLVVELNPRLLAAILGDVAEADVERVIDFLCSPDPRSRSKIEGGRRLVRLGEFLFWVVNGRKYRAMQDPYRRREQNREAKRRERAKRRVKVVASAEEQAFVRADGDGEIETADEIAGRAALRAQRENP